ncbi:hypothetical protein [Nesterenkonia halobia]
MSARWCFGLWGGAATRCESPEARQDQADVLIVEQHRAMISSV